MGRFSMTPAKRKTVLKLVARKYPAAFGRAVSLTALNRGKFKSFRGLGAINDGTINSTIEQGANDKAWYESLFDNLGKILPAVAQYDLQKDLNKINLERAKAGQEPIPNEALGTQIGLGVSRETRNMIYIMFGGVVLLGALALMKKR